MRGKTIALVLALAVVAGTSVVLASGGPSTKRNPVGPLGAGYDLSWWTVDAGGATFSTGGPYTLGSTIGQPDAGLLTGAAYALAGGFWRAGAAGHTIHLPLILRSH
jgi:hypothetical protein